MNKIKNIVKKSLKNPYSAIAMLSLVLVIFQMVSQNGVTYLGYLSYLTSPVVLILNYLPIFLMMFFVCSMTNRVRLSFITTGCILSIGILVNDYKICFRNEPFRGTDLALIGETANIMENYKLSFRALTFIPAIILIVMFVIFALRVKSKPLSNLTRIIGIILAPVLLVGAFFAVYQNNDTTENVGPFANIYNQASLSAHAGFINYFLSSDFVVEYDEPEGYSDAQTLSDLCEYGEFDDSQVMPNVIAVMGESFWDFTKAEELTLAEGANPLQNYKKIKKAGISGNMIVPGFGGGTARTEFEFLTAGNVSQISGALPEPYQSIILGKIYALPQMFKDMGYTTEAYHLGHEWFYNRLNVYRNMGFDDITFIEDMKGNVESIHHYAADSETTKLILNNYDKYLKSGKDNGYFSFSVTIQGHGPYEDKNADRGVFVERSAGMSDSIYYTLNNYVAGMNDTDKMIGDIREYIDSISEPTVFVFFGDHLPYFDSDNQTYKIIGYNISTDNDEGALNHNMTQYFIYANNAAKNLAKKHGASVKPRENELISSSFLSLELMDLMGLDQPPYYKIIHSVYDKIKVMAPSYYKTEDGIVHSLSDEQAELIRKYKCLQYYNLKQKGIRH